MRIRIASSVHFSSKAVASSVRLGPQHLDTLVSYAPTRISRGGTMNIVATILGVVIVVLTVGDVVLTVILPRRPSGIERLSLQINRSVRVCFVLVSRLAKTYEGQDAILAPTGPVALVVQLFFWAALLVLGFGLPPEGPGGRSPVGYSRRPPRSSRWGLSTPVARPTPAWTFPSAPYGSS